MTKKCEDMPELKFDFDKQPMEELAPTVDKYLQDSQKVLDSIMSRFRGKGKKGKK